ncbi:hypothetical protein [Streptomyces capillispiralis]|uniref:Uncharacterized protein n=1 Tax=Streptomyces capillispiralis TaxID=68182 RepID=A0A561TRZ7_9ACTN|nr:hypothetical protein [Streptomyces capillispiralis]TWF89891.1 hypothetical protein FHX78_116939 [Streptomyces capillispiralis]GHH95716.1 hypothetical protein GCM10017779_61730 [Streptomyces capillispiralis]
MEQPGECDQPGPGRQLGAEAIAYAAGEDDGTAMARIMERVKGILAFALRR